MDIDKVNILLQAIQTGSFSDAAMILDYTPSGISRVIASLEKETGFPLLIRSYNGVHPTAECEKLLPVMQELVRQANQYKQISAEICGLETGCITIGTAYNTYCKQLSTLIAEYIKLHPGISVRFMEGTSSSLVAMLEDGTADFCIVSQRQGNFRWYPLCQDSLVAWVPANHPSVEKNCFPLKNFSVEPYIDAAPGQETDNSLFFYQMGVLPNTKFSTYDSYTAYTMVEAGLGVTLTSALLASTWSGNVKTVPLDPPQTINIGVAIPTEDAISPAAKSFMELAVKYLT